MSNSSEDLSIIDCFKAAFLGGERLSEYGEKQNDYKA